MGKERMRWVKTMGKEAKLPGVRLWLQTHPPGEPSYSSVGLSFLLCAMELTTAPRFRVVLKPT